MIEEWWRASKEDVGKGGVGKGARQLQSQKG
jgi:hypothetical protein